MIKKLIPLLIYGFGIVSLTGVDVVVTKFFGVQDISDWAEVRSLIGLASILCLVGQEQVFMRSPQSSARIFKALSLQIPLLATIVGWGIWALGYVSSWIYGIFLVAGAAVALAVSQYFRSHRLLIQSQIAQQGWRVLALVAFGFMAITGVRVPVDPLVTGLVVGVAITLGLLTMRHAPSSLSRQDPEPSRALYAIGVRFMATSLFLASAIYAEQLLVNGVGTAEEGASYFAHATYFLFPASAVNGYLGFVIGPWIRDHHDKAIALTEHKKWLIGAASVVYALAANIIGWIAWKVVSPSVGSVDVVLQGLFFCTCVATTLYTFPSAYNGIFGQPRQHDFLILAQVLSLIAAGGLFSVLYGFANLPLTHAVAIASSVNWIGRVGSGFWMVRIISSYRRSNHDFG
ncbi:hypothetical protein [Pigmentiphaga sp. NML080357]|uniref:hypothetical protein n=1 Tax=Pigmentiphaga sp. NML080357 TaxID=2008675 RepID=UPI001185610E|nr:hypothetical protein [Pigmentiphaga sp. NML080357]